MNFSQPKLIDLDFVQIELYKDYIISSIKEGVVFDIPQQKRFYEIFDKYYPNKPFGYISNRKFDYTVNPTSYLQHSLYPRMVGMAILCYSENSYNTALFEKGFNSQPFQPFYTMEECKNWIQEKMRVYKKIADL